MDTQKMVRLSLLVSLATVLSILESQLTIPLLPWLKLGLANIMTLIALTIYGAKAAITVACIRALLAGIFGTLPMLAFSFSAALSSSTAMGVLYRISREKLSIVGISVVGAIIHNITQLFVAFILLRLSHSSLLALTPFMVLFAVGSGIITGFIARYINRAMNIQTRNSFATRRNA
jgi:heptaprenyl diphosphate synthase